MDMGHCESCDPDDQVAQTRLFMVEGRALCNECADAAIERGVHTGKCDRCGRASRLVKPYSQWVCDGCANVMAPRNESVFSVEVRDQHGAWSTLVTHGRKCLFDDVAEANDVACREGLWHQTRVVQFSRGGAVSKFPKETP